MLNWKTIHILLATNAYLSERRRRLSSLVYQLNNHFNHKQIFFTTNLESEFLRGQDKYKICLELYYTDLVGHEDIDFTQRYDTFKKCGPPKKLYVAFGDLTIAYHELQSFGENFYTIYIAYLQDKINENSRLPKKLFPLVIKVCRDMTLDFRGEIDNNTLHAFSPFA